MGRLSPYEGNGVDKFFQTEEGVSWIWDAGTHHESCCDCGLVHKVKYVPVDSRGKPIRGARLRITVWRHRRLTAQQRKRLKKGVVIV